MNGPLASSLRSGEEQSRSSTQPRLTKESVRVECGVIYQLELCSETLDTPVLLPSAVEQGLHKPECTRII
jgi:hypothetical protein